jgi:hypothetical protein
MARKKPEDDATQQFVDEARIGGSATKTDPATTRVAQKVIELAQRGIRDVATLRAMTLKEFNREE